MEANVTQDEISKLPLAAKALFAIACARIARDGFARRQLSNPPEQLESVFLEAERLGRLPSAPSNEKAVLVREISDLVARADLEPASQWKSALARSIRAAVEVLLLQSGAVDVQTMAAKHANEAYRWALHATRTAPLGAAVPAEREFQVRIREVFDALRESVPAQRTTE